MTNLPRKINKIPVLPPDFTSDKFVAGQDFFNISGTTLEVTVDSLPDFHENIMVFVNGELQALSEDYTINEDTITFNSALDNDRVQIRWFLDEAAFKDRNPSRIIDLSPSLVSSTSFRLTWTSGGGFANQGRPTRYRLYYSQGLLTQDNYNRASNILISGIAIPQYGQPIVANIGGFEPGKTFTVGIIAETVLENGVVRESLLSNVVSVSMLGTIVPEPNSRILNILPFQIIDHHRKQPRGNEENPIDFSQFQAENIVDGNIVVDENGEPLLESDTGEIYQTTATGYYPWTNYRPFEIVIDLQEVKRVDHLFFMPTGTGNSLGTVTISLAVLGEDYVDAFTWDNTFGDLDFWRKITIPANLKQARYIKISHTDPGSIKEVVVFGSDLFQSLPVGSKKPMTPAPLPFEKVIGSNVFLNDIIADWMKFGVVHRIYNNYNWFLPAALTNNPDVRLTDSEGGIPIVYQFEGQRVTGNQDELLQEVKNLQTSLYGVDTCETFYNLKNIYPFLVPQGLSMSGRSSWKPVDTEIYPSSSDTTDPASYRFVSKFCYSITARYGRATGAPSHLLSLHPEEVEKQGLDLIKFLQPWNEPNLTWEGQEGYFSPQELAAFMSAVYDGHKGALGPGYGIKTADPSMLVVFPGLVGQNVEYLERFLHWCDTFRGPGDYPFDIISMHYYHNTAGGQTSDPFRRGLSPDTVAPRGTGSYYDVMKKITAQRDRLMPHKEVWLSETGYDEGINSRQSLVPIDNVELGLLKARGISKIFLHCLAAGIDRVQHYMYRNVADLAQVNTTTFASTYVTSGYVDFKDGFGGNDPLRYTPLDSYWYIRSMLTTLLGYKFSHVIRGLNTTFVEDILKLESDSISQTTHAYAFEKEGEPPIIALWLGSYEDATTQIKVKSSELNAQLIRLEGTPDIQSETGITSSISSVIDGDGDRVFQINLDEGVTFIKGVDPGVPAIEPVELFASNIDANSIRLYWYDPNRKTMRYRILQYDEGAEDFVVIFDDFNSNQAHTVAEIDPDTETTYIVQAYDPVSNRESVFSNEVSIITFREIPMPENLRQAGINYDRITLEWDYEIEDESLISGFEITRSMTPTGSYTALVTMPPNTRTFTNIGLQEDTTYYYKIQAISNFGNSTLSGALGITTAEANLDPPVPIYAASQFYGDELDIYFNIPVNVITSVVNNFTVFESGASVPIKNIDEITVSPSNPNMITIKLSTPIEDADNTVLVGYDGLGSLQSDFTVGVEEFEDYPVLNLTNSDTLVQTKVSISMNGSASGPGGAFDDARPTPGSNWNEAATDDTTSTTYIFDNLIDGEGNPTDIVLYMPRKNTTPVLILGTAVSLGNSPSEGPIFPEFAKLTGHQGSGFMPESGFARYSFQNLNPDSKYRFTIFANSSAGSDKFVNLRVNQDSDNMLQWQIDGNNDDVYIVDQVVPIVDNSVDNTTSTTIPFQNEPRAILDFTREGANVFRIGAIMIEEVERFNFVND